MLNEIKQWAAAAGIRSVKTFCETLGVLIGTNYVDITALDWPTLLGISATTAVVALLTCVSGLPEVEFSPLDAVRGKHAKE